MRYFKVDWRHDVTTGPTVIYVEIDEERWEHRKMEVFRDGRVGFADEHEEVGGSMLGLEPWPDLGQLANEPEFDVSTIDKDEFEALWRKRR